ncbi:NADH-quinone oxidoreductase subunit J [Halovivax limisalsi]|uniref:NADH-quinone oxidoreductase subunit J n=1 Tax=Halovivax limisalsi TaxID=1453760 RepID=UPI001FFDE3A4|nr:NADH-quinone oxidoreductase subunit J [Halovivax limisalsi]
MPETSRSPSWPLSLIALGIAVLVVASAGSAVAAPPPKSLCGVCGDTLPGATDDGTLEIHVDESGDSRWVARVPVNESTAAAYRDNGIDLVVDVNERWNRYDVAVDDAANIQTRVSDGTVVVEYTVEDVAREGMGGAWIVEYFYRGGTGHRYELRADAVTVTVPNGSVVTNRPPDANVDGRSVTWTQETAGGIGGLSSKTYLTYGDDGVGGRIAAMATAARSFGPAKVADGALAAVGPVAVLGVATAVLGLAIGRWERRPASIRRLARRVGASTATERIVDHLRGRGVGGRGLVLGALIAAAVVAAVGWPTVGWPTGINVAAFVLGVGLFVPFGYVVGAGRRPWGPGVLLALVPTLPLLAHAPYVWPVGAGIVFVGWSLLVVLVGAPLAVLGWRYGRADVDEEPDSASGVTTRVAEND